MQAYQPAPIPEPERYTDWREWAKEFVRWADQDSTTVQQAAQDLNEKLRLKVLYAAPEKLNEGDIIFADGTTYDPSNGKGLYFYDQSDALYKIGGATLATEKSLTGATVDFTDIPAGVRRVTVMMRAMSSDGSNNILVQIGDSGGVETSGYTGGTVSSGGGLTTWSAGIQVTVSGSSSRAWEATVYLTLQDSTDNAWTASGSAIDPNGPVGAYYSGSKALSATLDRVRINANGSNFDAGTVSILYD